MFRKRNPAIGAPPGTLVFRKDKVPARVQIARYSKDALEVIPEASLDDVHAQVEPGTLLWIDVAGIDDPEVLRAGGKRFGLSDLMMERIVNVPHRPSSEFFGEQLLSIAHILQEHEDGSLDVDQLSIVLGKNFVISVHSQAASLLDPIRRRLEAGDTRLRDSDTGYLAYSILDTVVDKYYPLLESIGEQLESLEDDALENPDTEVLKEIHRLRSKLIQIRRSSWPMRESFEELLEVESQLFDAKTRTFLRDSKHHCAQIVDVVEMYRESAATLVSTYMSSVAHRSNEIMKVLALVSSIFVPMTFIAGVYGMNFENMPELSFSWSYPIALAAMLLSAGGMLMFFVRQGWLGADKLRGGLTSEKLLVQSSFSTEDYQDIDQKNEPSDRNKSSDRKKPRRPLRRRAA